MSIIYPTQRPALAVLSSLAAHATAAAERTQQRADAALLSGSSLSSSSSVAALTVSAPLFALSIPGSSDVASAAASSSPLVAKDDGGAAADIQLVSQFADAELMATMRELAALITAPLTTAAPPPLQLARKPTHVGGDEKAAKGSAGASASVGGTGIYCQIDR